jgi:hypothetical protein
MNPNDFLFGLTCFCLGWAIGVTVVGWITRG